MNAHGLRRLSRRELIAAALCAGTTCALGLPAAADGSDTGDGALLGTALRYEQLSVLAYRRVLGLGVLSSTDRGVIAPMLTQERAHVRALQRELSALGSPLPPPPTGYAQVDSVLSDHGMSSDLTSVSSRKDALQILLDIEALCEGAYYLAVKKLGAATPLVLAVRALGDEAQHSTLLAQLIHPGDVKQMVPSWYVSGVS